MSGRLLIMAGGTGGHVFPALAVADELRARGWEIHWLGTRGRLEERLVPRYDIPLHFINVQGVRGNGMVRLAKAPFKILGAIWQAMAAIKQIHPDVVLGMGGYASGPGGVAAWLKRIPLVLHEQNAAPGLTNRWLAKIAQRVLTAFGGTFPARETVLGNPLRADILQLPEPEQRFAARAENDNGRLNLLVVGGSLGAQVLNQNVPAALAREGAIWHVRHQTGAGRVDEVKAAYSQLGIDAHADVQEFIEDMAEALAWADLVVCRAGALTVSELASVGVASVLVPLPHAVDDHQTKNARVLVDAGAGVLMPQTDLNETSLAAQLSTLADRNTLLKMAKSAREAAMPNACRDVAEVIEQMQRRNR